MTSSSTVDQRTAGVHIVSTQSNRHNESVRRKTLPDKYEYIVTLEYIGTLVSFQ
jgi:hypothetical protein